MMSIDRLLKATALALLSGCSSAANFPLCPAIAANSFPSVMPGAVINNYVDQQIKSRKLQLKMLSPFTAEISGNQSDVKWMAKNYKFMLCAFNPKNELEDRATYLSCMNHADEWFSIVNSDNPEQLLITQTKFKENCVRSRLS